MWVRFAALQIARVLLITLIAGLLGAALVRFSPGFDVDERDLDTRLSSASHAADAEARAGERNLLSFYGQWLLCALHGDYGNSRAMNRPVGELIRERLPLTARTMAVGGAIGLLAGFLGAAAAVWKRSRLMENILGPGNGLLLAAPPAVVALLFLWLNIDPALAIAAAVSPYVFRYAHNLLRESASSAHVVTARARGLGEGRIFLAHVFVPALPQLAALGGIVASVAFGAAIPVEVICDRPGIGQLAWQAAVARDMPVLVAITMLVTALILVVNAAAEIALAGVSTEAA